MEKVTSLKRESDVKPAYKALLKRVNKNCYGKMLSEEPALFVWEKIEEQQIFDDNFIEKREIISYYYVAVIWTSFWYWELSEYLKQNII